jgi:hypothetical protein
MVKFISKPLHSVYLNVKHKGKSIGIYLHRQRINWMQCQFSVFSFYTVQLQFLTFHLHSKWSPQMHNPSFTAIDNVLLLGWKWVDQYKTWGHIYTTGAGEECCGYNIPWNKGWRGGELYFFVSIVIRVFKHLLLSEHFCFVLYTLVYTIHTFKRVSDKCQIHTNLPCSALHCHSAVSIPHVRFALPTELFPFHILGLYSLCIHRMCKNYTL